MNKILIIEDEIQIINFLKNGLKSAGYFVEYATNGNEGLNLASKNFYDLIILDIILPDLNGLEVCRKIKDAKIKSLIIMLTAKDTTEDKIKGLEIGADDYLVKPFSFLELLARIKALQRRVNNTPSPDEKLIIADLELDPNSFSVKRNGKTLKLSATEFKFLKFLMENTDKVASKAMILEKIWGYNFLPETNIVEVYINSLREKIDKNQATPLIHTIHGIGYRLCEEI